MIIEVRKSPMTYYDGVPAHKAGEWPGRMPCKFMPTRKSIRPLTEGIIFNENEPPLMPKRRNLSQGPSKEYQFKPCIKIVKPESDSKNKNESIKVIKPVHTEMKQRPERKHYFEYREQQIEQLQNREKDSNNKMQLNEEFRVLGKVGFSKKALESLPNNKLLGINFSKDFKSFNFTSNFEDKKAQLLGRNNKSQLLDNSAKSLWQKQEQEKINNIRLEKENLKRDVDYVRTLDNWDKSFLPKLNINK